MSNRNRLLTILAALALAASHGTTSAASNPNLGPNITRTYTTAELSSAYGILQIGKDELWMLNFPDTVTDVLTTREGVLDTKMMGSTVALAAILPSGSLPVAIKLANGLTQYFLVTLSASHGGGVRNIVVRDATGAEPSPPPGPATVTPQSTSASGGARYSVQPAAPRPAQPQVSPANRRQLTEPPSAAQTAAPVTSRPNPASPATRSPYTQPTYSQSPYTRSQPAVSALPGATSSAAAYSQPQIAGPQMQASAGWATQTQATQTPAANSSAQVPLQAQFALQLDGPTLVLYYRLNNPGFSPYTLNDAQIRVSSAGQLLPVSGRGPLTLAGGASTYGTVTLPAGGLQVASGLAVEWNAQDQATGAVTVLRSFVNVQQASMPNWKRIALAGVSSHPLMAGLR